MVLPYIKMNLPQVYMCSPSWTLLPPPSPYHPSGSSQCTSPKHPVSCIEPGLATHLIYDIIHISMPFSQIIPPSPSPTSPKDCSIGYLENIFNIWRRKRLHTFFLFKIISVPILKFLLHAVLSHFSRVQLFATAWTVAHQAPLSTRFSSKNTGLGCCALLQGIFVSGACSCYLLSNCPNKLTLTFPLILCTRRVNLANIF